MRFLIYYTPFLRKINILVFNENSVNLIHTSYSFFYTLRHCITNKYLAITSSKTFSSISKNGGS